jgi:hypothetical protein
VLVLNKSKLVVATITFVAAWIFLTSPGRRIVEKLGLYTACAIDVWSLRKHCTPSRSGHDTAPVDHTSVSQTKVSADPSSALAAHLLNSSNSKPHEKHYPGKYRRRCLTRT